MRFLNPLISFVESVTDNGHNVLIHCLAGAHRAGTSGIVWLMYVHQLKAAEAIKLAKAEGDDFISANKEKEGVQVTDSGLQYIVHEAGVIGRHDDAEVVGLAGTEIEIGLSVIPGNDRA